MDFIWHSMYFYVRDWNEIETIYIRCIHICEGKIKLIVSRGREEKERDGAR